MSLNARNRKEVGPRQFKTLEIMQTAQTQEEKLKAFKYEIFKEVAESNFLMFQSEFNKAVFDYRALNTHKITEVLNEEEVRQLAVNFFSMMAAKAAYENQKFYFDKKLTVKL